VSRLAEEFKLRTFKEARSLLDEVRSMVVMELALVGSEQVMPYQDQLFFNFKSAWHLQARDFVAYCVRW
jgi:hypothetical protein